METKDNNTSYRGKRLECLCRAFLAVIMLAAVLPVAAESVIPFSRDRASLVAVIVRDLATGRDVISQNPHKAMLPASTMKCLTAAAAIEAGLDTVRFETRVYTRGKIEDGALLGDLVIEGAGDPTIESAQFQGNPSFIGEIVRAVKGMGIKSIEGEIQVDASTFPDNGPCDRWELSDVRYEYGAGLYALNYRDNKVGDKAMEEPAEAFGEALENRLAAEGIAVCWQTVDTGGADDRDSGSSLAARRRDSRQSHEPVRQPFRRRNVKTVDTRPASVGCHSPRTKAAFVAGS